MTEDVIKKIINLVIIMFRKKKSSKEMKKKAIQKGKSGTKFVAFICILFSIIFYGTSSFVIPLLSEAYKLPLISPELDKTLIGILNLLAGSLLTVGFFSILMGLNDFIEYITLRLRSIVVEHTYLKDLSTNQRDRLRASLDELKFGVGTLQGTDSLYRFLNYRISKLYNLPYRTNFHDIYYYHKTEDPDLWLQVNHTNYVFYKNDVESVEIAWELSILKYKNKLSINSLKELTIQIDDQFLECSEKSAKGTQNIGNNTVDTILVKPDSRNEILVDEIELTVESDRKSDPNSIFFSFSVALPDEMFDEEKNFVAVEISAKTLLPKVDNYVMVSMAYPTKDLLLLCEFKSGKNLINGVAFGFQPKLAYNIKTNENSGLVDIKEWVLPGHGAVLTWYPLDNKNKHDKIIIRKDDTDTTSEGK